MNKFTLALCDDEDFVHDRIGSLLEEFTEALHIEFILLHFYSASELIETVHRIDCLLLDMEMPEIDGIVAARKIRHQHKEYPIIILAGQTTDV